MKLKLPPLFTLITFFLCVNSIFLFAQSKEGKKFDELDKKYLNWYNLNPDDDKIQGVSVDLAYKTFLKENAPKKNIIVAVIDAGVDVEHEDLKDKIWVNKNEIPDNGIDDDNNGYIDDIYGWNFIGNSKGENIKYENYEYVRIYRDLRVKYDSLESEDCSTEECKLFKECKKLYDDEFQQYKKLKETNDRLLGNIGKCDTIFTKYFGHNNYTESDIKAIYSSSPQVKSAKSYMNFLFKQRYTKESFARQVERAELYVNYYLNVDLKSRKIINDDIKDINDNNYGNGDVKWEGSDHGTFVAGIIAANRNNNIGINGIAENVKIMVLRTVPDGDELDKDVALSIRYAVDNGANIINMSFGKKFSPDNEMVHDAIKYASENGVLLVHAAGNDGINTDFEARYPNDKISDDVYAETWVEVGAVSIKLGKKFCGVFSNYGPTNVDVFAPGVDIFSLYPDDTYSVASGTSFASPVFSGVAALVWSCFPELSAVELKEILLTSGTTFPKKKVYKPGEGFAEKQKVMFSELSQSGSVVNAINALILAKNYMKEK